MPKSEAPTCRHTAVPPIDLIGRYQPAEVRPPGGSGRQPRRRNSRLRLRPGAFWKRFDKVEGGVATGHVVNYEISALPGKPQVRTTYYPDNARACFRQGDPFLLLNYTNHPYEVVYDAIFAHDHVTVPTAAPLTANGKATWSS
jgi:hypothetical protein